MGSGGKTEIQTPHHHVPTPRGERDDDEPASKITVPTRLEPVILVTPLITPRNYTGAQEYRLSKTSTIP